jgi:small-conductance mechanosensitive channel
VRSNVLFALWDAFKREGVEIPYPVRDLRMDKPMRVAMERDSEATAGVGTGDPTR